jgi:hypothetical protein
MDRRAFVLGAFGAVAATSMVLGSSAAEAAPMPVAVPEGTDEAQRLESDYRPEVDGEAKTEEAQYGYYYRPRRVYYRPRRVYYRRRYRPRRVYYYRPRRRIRRRYYRRVYW